MTDETVQLSATQQHAGDGAPGATAAFPYDRMTVERFRAAFPRTRWRDDLGAWFVPGTTAEQVARVMVAAVWRRRRARDQSASSRASDGVQSWPVLSVAR